MSDPPEPRRPLTSLRGSVQSERMAVLFGVLSWICVLGSLIAEAATRDFEVSSTLQTFAMIFLLLALAFGAERLRLAIRRRRRH